VRFTVSQNANVAPQVAVAAYGNPAFYEGRPERDHISVVEVVSHEETGSRVHIQVRFKFSGSVSGAVRAVIDPNKMSWITRTEVDLDELTTTFQVLPDHYPDRLTSSGYFRFAPGGAGADSCVVTVDGEMKVHVPLVGRTVERVIVSGLRSYIGEEVSGLADFAAGA
jgi:hypothetical protein